MGVSAVERPARQAVDVLSFHIVGLLGTPLLFAEELEVPPGWGAIQPATQAAPSLAPTAGTGTELSSPWAGEPLSSVPAQRASLAGYQRATSVLWAPATSSHPGGDSPWHFLPQQV